MIKCLHYSDTHGLHTSSRMWYPTHKDGFDIMFHTGDLCNHGSYMEALDFIYHCNDMILGGQFKHIIITPGNHDFIFTQKDELKALKKLCHKNLHILVNRSIEIMGYKIYGSPMTPRFRHWDFMYDDKDAKRVWGKIPKGTDILLTHGPAYDILDASEIYPSLMIVPLGCEALKARIDVVKPIVHLCGHIHMSYGYKEVDGVHHFNGAILNGQYRITNMPHAFTIDGKELTEIIY